ncbi:hypothetical protein AB4Z32_27865, partial [Massilia sp. 2TAF26]|uniref:hypothetical protein n=1 Tax=Massilia sp. 2TAF26 TaxID=3233012 RepID=UPI003F970163
AGRQETIRLVRRAAQVRNRRVNDPPYDTSPQRAMVVVGRIIDPPLPAPPYGFRMTTRQNPKDYR